MTPTYSVIGMRMNDDEGLILMIAAIVFVAACTIIAGVFA